MKYEEFVTNEPGLAKYAVRDRDMNISHIVNPGLAKSQGITNEDIAALVQLHKDRLDLLELMRHMDPEEDKESLYECHLEWTEGEFKMQELWGFGRDVKFHKFWELPHCSCASMDNGDAYPTGYYSKSGGCYHWIGVKEEADKEAGKVEFNDFVEKQDIYADVVRPPLQTYKSSLKYRLKKVGEVLLMGLVAFGATFTVFYLAANQEVFKGLSKYILGGF